ncbi:hypothetical protein [Euzebya tangerina]|uniref:hypothetical protein n=1 Tax=Euzebya tangerina TaxID=591198 RepID=UPI000E30C3C6|nr:hypothetical protein [Euzebya tangerina]
MTKYAVPLVLLIAAAGLAYLRLDGVTFNITPLYVGVTALVAVAVGPKPRPWTSGIVITAWGIAVLLVREGPLPSREAPVFMIAVGLGLLLAAVLEPANRQAAVVRGGALAIASGGALFYLAFDVSWLRSWWTFAGGLAVAAVVEAGRAAATRR